MSAIAEIVAGILSLILEWTIYTIVFLFKMVRAIFSPSYRQDLLIEWNASHFNKFAMLLFFAILCGMAALVFMFWSSLLMPDTKEQPETASLRNSVTNQLSAEELRRIKDIKSTEQFVDVAKEIIQRKRAEQDQAMEQGEKRNTP